MQDADGIKSDFIFIPGLFHTNSANLLFMLSYARNFPYIYTLYGRKFGRKIRINGYVRTLPISYLLITNSITTSTKVFKRMATYNYYSTKECAAKSLTPITKHQAQVASMQSKSLWLTLCAHMQITNGFLLHALCCCFTVRFRR